MVSKCCGSDIYPVSALYSVQLCSDYYICSQCELPCDMVYLRDKDDLDEQI